MCVLNKNCFAGILGDVRDVVMGQCVTGGRTGGRGPLKVALPCLAFIFCFNIFSPTWHQTYHRVIDSIPYTPTAGGLVF